MDLARNRTDGSAPAAAVGLGLAVCSAVSFAVADRVGFLTPTAEGVFTVAWLVGWALLAWAIVVGGAVAVHVLRGMVHRRPPVLLDAALIVATIAVIGAVVAAHPLMGSGSGVG